VYTSSLNWWATPRLFLIYPRSLVTVRIFSGTSWPVSKAENNAGTVLILERNPRSEHRDISRGRTFPVLKNFNWTKFNVATLLTTTKTARNAGKHYRVPSWAPNWFNRETSEQNFRLWHKAFLNCRALKQIFHRSEISSTWSCQLPRIVESTVTCCLSSLSFYFSISCNHLCSKLK